MIQEKRKKQMYLNVSNSWSRPVFKKYQIENDLYNFKITGDGEIRYKFTRPTLHYFYDIDSNFAGSNSDHNINYRQSYSANVSCVKMVHKIFFWFWVISDVWNMSSELDQLLNVSDSALRDRFYF